MNHDCTIGVIATRNKFSTWWKG